MFLSGQAWCMLVNPLKKIGGLKYNSAWNNRFFEGKLDLVFHVMDKLDYDSNAQFLGTCKYLHKEYKGTNFDLSPNAYMDKMIYYSRQNNKDKVRWLMEHEGILHKKQRESILQYFKVNYSDLAAVMEIYKKEYDPECEDFMKLKTEVQFKDLASNPIVCQLSLEQGLSPNIVDTNTDHTLLVRAVRERNSEVVKLLLKGERIDPNKGIDVLTPLIVAVVKENSEIIKILLADKRIDPNQGDEDGLTPLIAAATKGNSEATKLLLADERINPNQESKLGLTPLISAILEGNAEVVKLLLADKRIDPNKENKDGVTPLTVADNRGNPEVIKLLLADERIDPNKGVDGMPPLMLAVGKGNLEAIKLLLEDKRIDPNKETDGVTPLMIAVWKGNSEVIKLLLESEKVNAFSRYTAKCFYLCRCMYKTIVG